ncbi:glutaminase [Microbacterium sp. YMB-B2]|uniref:Glutaminase n=1 Tax=Microbacterium tenebrionis TaxID=2830665 RepID=A0A9X1LLT2_9MICO|nr:glutaminase [Microbacterium tenebrionis]MCC2028029.1 glutaminase [Microbacterium tenebrionis]
MTTTAALLDAARVALAGVAKEGLGEERSSRWRGERIVRIGQAWHVGVLLLTDDRVLATGEVLRAADPGRRGYTAESARERAARRQMALRGGFREGEVVHVGWSVIELDAVDAGGASGPLAMRDGVVSVRWSGDSWRPLEGYLSEQVELLLAR